MKKIRRVLSSSALFLSFASCSAMQVEAMAEQATKKSSALEKFTELKNKAILAVTKSRGFGEPRKVMRGSYPEIVLKGGRIFFNEKELSFGGSLEAWKKVLGGSPRCSGTGMTLCIWDNLGLDIGTSHADNRNVKFFNIQINLPSNDMRSGGSGDPENGSANQLPDLRPHHVFSGYLELDGVGIDAKTKFWEIRSGSIGNGRLHCGLHDCSNPSGPFSEHSNIYLTLDGRGESDRLLEFGLSVFDLE